MQRRDGAQVNERGGAALGSVRVACVRTLNLGDRRAHHRVPGSPLRSGLVRSTLDPKHIAVAWVLTDLIWAIVFDVALRRHLRRRVAAH